MLDLDITEIGDRQAFRKLLEVGEAGLVVARDHAAKHRGEVAPDNIQAVVGFEAPMDKSRADARLKANQDFASPGSPGLMTMPTYSNGRLSVMVWVPLPRIVPSQVTVAPYPGYCLNK